MAGLGQYQGSVENKHFHISEGEARQTVRLTSMTMAAAMPPESQELDLSQYEGQTITVEGYLSGEWIYSARVVEGQNKQKEEVEPSSVMPAAVNQTVKEKDVTKLSVVSDETARKIKLTASVPAGFLFPSPETAKVSKKTKPGKERWPVKTGTDPDVEMVGENIINGEVLEAGIVNTTVEELINIPRPTDMEPPNQGFPAFQDQRSEPVEITIWRLDADIIALKMEDDGDYHLVLQGASGDTMIAEVPTPDPPFVEASSPFRENIKQARQQIDEGLLSSLPQTVFVHPVGQTLLPQASLIPSVQEVVAPQAVVLPTADQQMPVEAFKMQVRRRARITGVGFFDRVHNQTGVSQLNGIELHPVLEVEWLD